MDIGNILGHPDIDLVDLVDLINTADTDIDTRMETREDVWGYESFDVFQTPDYGLCLPATLVEGSQVPTAADDDSLNVPDSALLEECQNNQKMSREFQLSSLSPHPQQHSTSTPFQRRR